MKDSKVNGRDHMILHKVHPMLKRPITWVVLKQQRGRATKESLTTAGHQMVGIYRFHKVCHLLRPRLQNFASSLVYICYSGLVDQVPPKNKFIVLVFDPRVNISPFKYGSDVCLVHQLASVIRVEIAIACLGNIQSRLILGPLIIYITTTIIVPVVCQCKQNSYLMLSALIKHII